MSEANFTENNWTLRGSEIGIVDTSDTQSHGMMLTICRVDRFDFCDNWRANAQLIAAAPKMYAMLEEILKVYEMDYDDTGKVLKLLAEARGEL